MSMGKKKKSEASLFAPQSVDDFVCRWAWMLFADVSVVVGVGVGVVNVGDVVVLRRHPTFAKIASIWNRRLFVQLSL